MKPEISAKVLSNIKKRAKKFSASNKLLLGKIEADKELTLTRVRSHISLVLGMFKNEGIIDECSSTNPMDFLGVNGNVVCFTLKKNGYANFIHVFTDGKHVYLRGSGFVMDFGDLASNYRRLSDIEDVDTHDWVSFCNVLLDFIYAVIYNNVKLTELTLFGNSK